MQRNNYMFPARCWEIWAYSEADQSISKEGSHQAVKHIAASTKCALWDHQLFGRSAPSATKRSWRVQHQQLVKMATAKQSLFVPANATVKFLRWQV